MICIDHTMVRICRLTKEIYRMCVVENMYILHGQPPKSNLDRSAPVAHLSFFFNDTDVKKEKERKGKRKRKVQKSAYLSY